MKYLGLFSQIITPSGGSFKCEADFNFAVECLCIAAPNLHINSGNSPDMDNVTKLYAKNIKLKKDNKLLLMRARENSYYQKAYVFQRRFSFFVVLTAISYMFVLNDNGFIFSSVINYLLSVLLILLMSIPTCIFAYLISKFSESTYDLKIAASVYILFILLMPLLSGFLLHVGSPEVTY